MKKLSGYLTNYDAPSAGFSEGKFKDDPGDGTGSGAVVQTINDVWYGIEGIALKYLGGISDTDESETASDMLDSIEKAIGIQNENVIEYDNSTTYALDDDVMYLGIQFVSMVASNTGNDPIDNPDKWLPCFSRDQIMVKWRNGEDISGGFEPLHDKRDVTYYRMLFGAGKFNFGGDTGGSGRNFQATGLHLDGTTVTGNTTLENLLDVGGADEYHLLDIIAPDVLGTRTLIETLGRVARTVDDTGGDTEDVGVVQEDQFQNFQIGIEWLGITYYGIGRAPTNFVTGTPAATSILPDYVTTGQTNGDSIKPLDNGVDGALLTGSETRSKNYTRGVSYVIIIQEI